MNVRDRLKEIHGEMTEWRRDLHAHPETAFEEFRTSDVVAGKLEEFGIEVHRGLAGTGVVGVLKGNSDSAGGTIGLRADIDALDIVEQTNLPHSSKNPGKMHACGHDGHTTMLLGAAKYLAETRDFDGTVYFIFQPAEENEGGAKKMIDEGLFDQFPMDAVYGMHNWPGMAPGKFAVQAGPMMASFDIFEITITGKGAHGAMPHQGIDPIVVGTDIVSALQTIVSRKADPLDSAVVSVTQFHGGDAWNVIPEEVVLRGTTRSFLPEVQDLIEESINRIAKGISAAHGAEADVRYERRYPPTINAEAQSDEAARAAETVAGGGNVLRKVNPCMGAEDFAFMLNEKPGSYVWLGAGEESANLHSPHFDFNDEILPIGASYWATLVEEQLPAAR